MYPKGFPHNHYHQWMPRFSSATYMIGAEKAELGPPTGCFASIITGRLGLPHDPSGNLGAYLGLHGTKVRCDATLPLQPTFCGGCARNALGA